MASHCSDMGFDFKDVAELIDFAKNIYIKGKDIPLKNGAYRLVTIDKRIEFWIQFDKPKFFQSPKFLDLEFHYSSDNFIPIAFDRWIEPLQNLSGKAIVWYLQDDKEVFPIVVNIPNAAQYYNKLKKGEKLKMQVSCFCEELVLFATSEEFYDDQKERNAKNNTEATFADESFIPSGMFGNNDNPEPTAIFNGRITAYERRINSYADNDYYYITVECQGTTFDVLADPDLVAEDPKIGGILHGSFWLSGKFKKLFIKQGKLKD